MYKVLIVDDEELIREGIANEIDWLKLDCVVSDCVQNGIEAMEIIKLKHIDIIITDIKMPGMNGLELTQWVYSNFRSISIIILSGYSDFKFAQTAIKYGVVDFILKPTRLEEIEVAVEKIKKKLEVVKLKKQRLEVANGIIDKNKNLEVLKLINNIIFRNTDDLQVIKNKLANLNFNICLHRMVLIDIKMISKGFLEADEKVSYFIEYIENKILNFTEAHQIQILSQYKTGYLMFYIYSRSKYMNKNDFHEDTTKIIKFIEDDFNAFFHVNLVIGISDSDSDLNNIKKLYFNALKKADMSNFKKNNPEFMDKFEDINIKKLISPKFHELVCKRDVQGIYFEIESFFKKIQDNSITYYKGAAIELINYTDNLINNDSTKKSICKTKVYSEIINSSDTLEILHITKDALLSIYADVDIFLNEVEKEKIEDRVIDYLKINYYKNLKLDKVAETFYISTGHLSRILKKYYGKSFLELLTEIRVKNAEILLKNPKYKAYEVAIAVGFNDPKYFSQVFKKYTGKSPSDYK